MGRVGWFGRAPWLAAILFVVLGLSAGAAVAGLSSTYTYDAIGRLLTQTDSNGATISYTYDSAGNRVASTVMAPPTITTATLPTPVQGVAYSQTIATSGGTAPITFSVSAGTLPAGLALTASSGLISGTPTTSGAYQLHHQGDRRQRPDRVPGLFRDHHRSADDHHHDAADPGAGRRL